MTARTRRDGLLGAALVFATFAAYLPCLRGGMLWDDDGHVTAPNLRALAGLSRIWTELGATHQYYPLLHSAFWVEHRLWGDATLGYHLVNVALHAASACLLVFVLEALWVERVAPDALGIPWGRSSASGATRSTCWIAGFLFALHPVCVESVAWISEQKNALSGIFYLAAALVYLKFEEKRNRAENLKVSATVVGNVERSDPACGRSGNLQVFDVRLYAIATLLFLFALLSKTVTATLPAALLVAIWFKRGRLEFRRDVAPLLPWLLIGAVAGFFTAWVERHLVGAEGAAFALAPGRRCLLAGEVFWFYLAKAAWPARLSFIYPHWNLGLSAARQLLPLLAALSGFAWLAAAAVRGRRGPLAAALFFAGTLVPVLGFLNVFPFRYTYVADHFQYLAILGLIVPAAAGLAALSSRASRFPAGAAVLALGALTWNQAGLYRNEEPLYRAALARAPNSWMVQNNLGELISHDPARTEEAIGLYRASLQAYPEHAEAENNLGVALASLGRSEEAIGHYRAAIRLRPGYAEAENNLGNVLAGSGRLAEAVAHFQAALRLDPNSAQAENNLGNALLQSRHSRQAIEHYRAALRIDPDYAQARNDLAAALVRQGKFAEAEEELRAVLRRHPGDTQAAENLRRIEAYLSRGR